MFTNTTQINNATRPFGSASKQRGSYGFNIGGAKKLFERNFARAKRARFFLGVTNNSKNTTGFLHQIVTFIHFEYHSIFTLIFR